MAFVNDIRQENRNLHLMYKALFEASADRAEFVSRLFSRDLSRRDAGTAVDDLFEALARRPPSTELRAATGRLLRDRLVNIHRWPLAPEDLASMDYALDAFAGDGPDIHYSRSRPDSQPGPSYRKLMTSRDVGGLTRSFLATDRAFGFVKALHTRNLIVPVVGDFGGPGAPADPVIRRGVGIGTKGKDGAVHRRLKRKLRRGRVGKQRFNFGAQLRVGAALGVKEG